MRPKDTVAGLCPSRFCGVATEIRTRRPPARQLRNQRCRRAPLRNVTPPRRFGSGYTQGLLSSQVSYKTLDADLKPNSVEPYRLETETTTGGFFSLQHRDTGRFEWQEAFALHPINAWGQHLTKFGGSFVRTAYDSRQTFDPVQVLRIREFRRSALTSRLAFRRRCGSGNIPGSHRTNGRSKAR